MKGDYKPHPGAVKEAKFKMVSHMKAKKSKVNEAGNYTKPGMRKRMFQAIKAGSKG